MPQIHVLFRQGGVGKTTLAAATAMRTAQAGKRTLIVSTDPASNLADVFERPSGPGHGDRAEPVRLEIDPIPPQGSTGSTRWRFTRRPSRMP